MKKKDKIKKIYSDLSKLYPNVECQLNYSTDYELLFATRLSAQCTDVRVNKVTEELFSRYKTLEDYANADFEDMSEIVKSCGVYKMKAQNIIDSAKMILDEYGGKVPDNMEELLKLPGVGRKTANLILGEIYGKPAIIADTHCIRLSNRLGLCDFPDPLKVEITLKKTIPEEYQTKFCHLLVWHGRNFCKAKNPNCKECSLYTACSYSKKDK